MSILIKEFKRKVTISNFGHMVVGERCPTLFATIFKWNHLEACGV